MTEGPGWTPPGEPAPPAGPGAPYPGYPGPGYHGPGYPGGAGPWGTPRSGADYRPGIIALRPLGVGELLDGAFGAIRRCPRLLLGLGLAAAAASRILAVVALLVGGTAGGTIALGVVNAVISAVAVAGLTAAVVVVMSQLVLGRPVSAAEVRSRVRGRLSGVMAALGLLVLGAAVAIGVVIGLAVLSPPLAALAGAAAFVGAVYAVVAFSFATPVIVLESAPALAALRRSRELVRGAWWRTFGVLLLTDVIVTVIDLLVSLVVGAVSVAAGGGTHVLLSSAGTTHLVASTLLSGVLASAFSYPFFAGVLALLYVDRRMRTEGLDLVLLRAAGGGAGGTGSPPSAGPLG